MDLRHFCQVQRSKDFLGSIDFLVLNSQLRQTLFLLLQTFSRKSYSSSPQFRPIFCMSYGYHLSVAMNTTVN